MADAVPSPEVAPKERTAPAVFEYDSRFEFDAPRFYDFEALGRGGSPHGDHWFSTAPDGPGCKPDKGSAVVAREPLRAIQSPLPPHQHQQQQPPQSQDMQLQEQLQSHVKDAGRTPPGAAAAADKAQQQQQRNIVTSWAAAAMAGACPATTQDGGASEQRSREDAVPPPTAASEGQQPPPVTSSRAAVRKSLGTGARRVASSAVGDGGGGDAAVPPPQQPPAPSTQPAPRQSAQPTRSASAPRSRRRSSTAVAAAAVATSAAATATVSAGRLDGCRTEPPVTRSMSRLGAPLCSPVPEEAPRTRGTPRAAARTRKCATAYKTTGVHARVPPTSLQKLRRVLEPKVTKPLRSTKPLTLPDDFELHTSRLRPRSSAAAPLVGVGEAEQQQQAAAAGPGPSPFRSLAERVRDFQTKTPLRFKTRPSTAAASGGGRKRMSITVAKSPLLMTSSRTRPTYAKSREQLEDEELEAARREAFHARPVDARVLNSSGQLGVPRVDRALPTEPRPFMLRSEGRARTRAAAHDAAAGGVAPAASRPHTATRTQGAARSILDSAVAAPSVRDRAHHHHHVTVPKSPLLRTKLRSHSASKSEAAHKEERPRSAQHAAGNRTRASAGGPTLPAPFLLATEARGAQHAEELAARLAAEAERAKRQRRVTARPLPVTLDVPVVPPRPEARALTLPDPFHLKSLSRHEAYEQQHRQQLEEEAMAARRAADFKARPVHTGGPFVVHDSNAPLTVPIEPHFATDTRVVERSMFDAHVAERMRIEEEERCRAEEAKRKAEEEATREYRKKLRFTARPMPSFDAPYFTVPSDKPLTKAHTPKLATKRRQRGNM